MDLEMLKWVSEYEKRFDEAADRYYAWQTAEDNRRRNRKAEENDDLRYKATVLRNQYREARSTLYKWVCEHPAPEGAKDL